VTGPPSPYTVLRIADRSDLADIGIWVQRGAGILVVLATAVILTRRLLEAPPRQQRVLAPLVVYGITAVLFIPVSANLLFPGLLGDDPLSLLVFQLAVLAVVPLAFAAATALGGFARTAQLEDLAARLGADSGGRAALTEALAETLGDPSVELVFWSRESDGFVDDRGSGVLVPPAQPTRAAVDVELDGHRIGAVMYDSNLIADPETVRASGRVIAIGLEHERLTAELLASREGLRLSRARVVEAGDLERRRIARDLHDGLQGRLVVLGIRASEISRGSGEEAAAGAEELRHGLDDAVTELRELVQGVLPAALIERGLGAATEDLADRIPIPTKLDLDGAGRELPAPVETTGYFVIAEALANAVKHAQATELGVSVSRSNGDLRIEIWDDGVGGARAAGTGVQGMMDRVQAMGGELELSSPAGGGTRIVAVVPCAR
jgi:signal transduction histidine kinase